MTLDETQDNEKDNRVFICLELLDRANKNENFLKRIITDDKMCVYGYNIVTKMQSL